MIIEATYDNGVFTPKEPVTLAKGSTVRIIVPENKDNQDPVEIMATRYPESFGVLSEGEALELQKVLDEEFGRVNPDDWN